MLQCGDYLAYVLPG